MTSMKFTLRDLLWLILVCAGALSWGVSDRKREAELRSTVDRHKQAAGAWAIEKARFDPVAYRDFVYQREQETARAKRTSVVNDQRD
jgi:hypothetical protein